MLRGQNGGSTLVLTLSVGRSPFWPITPHFKVVMLANDQSLAILPLLYHPYPSSLLSKPSTTLHNTTSPHYNFIFFLPSNRAPHYTTQPHYNFVFFFLQIKYHNSFNTQQMTSREVVGMAWLEYFTNHHAGLGRWLHRKTPRGFQPTTKARWPESGCHEEECQALWQGKTFRWHSQWLLHLPLQVWVQWSVSVAPD